jgi:RNA polymerase sigma factor (sigma-70 family)
MTSDVGLLRAVASGDAEAFSTFYRRYLPGVLRHLLRETGNREVAADLAAEVFAAVLLGARRFRPRGQDTASGWVRGITRNKLLESRRRGRVEARARRELGLEPELLDDHDLARVEELASMPAVLELVDELPEAQRGAVRARVIDEREYEQIAREMDCSELVVRQRVSRGLAHLRERLSEEER